MKNYVQFVFSFWCRKENASLNGAMPNAESTSRVSPRVYKFFLSKQHKKMSNTCLIHVPIVI